MLSLHVYVNMKLKSDLHIPDILFTVSVFTSPGSLTLSTFLSPVSVKNKCNFQCLQKSTIISSLHVIIRLVYANKVRK